MLQAWTYWTLGCRDVLQIQLFEAAALASELIFQSEDFVERLATRLTGTKKQDED